MRGIRTREKGMLLFIHPPKSMISSEMVIRQNILCHTEIAKRREPIINTAAALTGLNYNIHRSYIRVRRLVDSNTWDSIYGLPLILHSSALFRSLLFRLFSDSLFVDTGDLHFTECGNLHINLFKVFFVFAFLFFHQWNGNHQAIQHSLCCRI